MSALARIIGGKPSGSASGGNNLAVAKTNALQHTHPDVPTPSHPGNFHSLRTMAVQVSPQFFTKEEAEELRTTASQRKKEVGYSKTAYKALTDIDDAETEVEGLHYDYLKSVAGNESKRLKAKVGLVSKLHRLRTTYDGLSQRVMVAQGLADKAIASNRQAFAAQLAGKPVDVKSEEVV